jgi:hypothetical protein
LCIKPASQKQKRPVRLLDYAGNVYSQNGEDGILSKILELLPVKDRWCVEFGAWDGKYFSNTCNLIERDGYSAVLIEPVGKRFADLVKNYASNRNVITLNRFVGFTPDNNLGHILSDAPIPKDFDLLSIDIEGNDYHAWDAIASYTPKVVHIPYNPTIPTEVDFVQPADPNVNQGQSLLALTRLASRKDYELVCVNHNSAFFVRSRYYSLFGIADNDPGALREDLSSITYLFSGYDGTLFVTGREGLPHHRGIRIQKRLRQLPKIFRSYPHNFGEFTKLLYKFYWRIARLLGRA